MVPTGVLMWDPCPTRAKEWCPPGHGDLYPAMVGSGTLDKLLMQEAWRKSEFRGPVPEVDKVRLYLSTVLMHLDALWHPSHVGAT